jgi:hypothetical protein
MTATTFWSWWPMTRTSWELSSLQPRWAEQQFRAQGNGLRLEEGLPPGPMVPSKPWRGAVGGARNKADTLLIPGRPVCADGTGRGNAVHVLCQGRGWVGPGGGGGGF